MNKENKKEVQHTVKSNNNVFNIILFSMVVVVSLVLGYEGYKAYTKQTACNVRDINQSPILEKGGKEEVYIDNVKVSKEALDVFQGILDKSCSILREDAENRIHVCNINSVRQCLLTTALFGCVELIVVLGVIFSNIYWGFALGISILFGAQVLILEKLYYCYGKSVFWEALDQLNNDFFEKMQWEN